MESSGFENSYLKLAIITAIIVVTDQITKGMILRNVPMYESIPIIPGFMNITHIHNPGGAFGIFAGQSPLIRKILFLFVSSAAVCFVFYIYRNTPRSFSLLQTSFGLIFAGAIGNLIDRIRFGTVIDFLDFHIKTWHWPAFNVADSAITIGVTIFVIHFLFDKLPDSYDLSWGTPRKKCQDKNE